MNKILPIFSTFSYFSSIFHLKYLHKSGEYLNIIGIEKNNKNNELCKNIFTAFEI